MLSRCSVPGIRRSSICMTFFGLRPGARPSRVIRRSIRPSDVRRRRSASSVRRPRSGSESREERSMIVRSGDDSGIGGRSTTSGSRRVPLRCTRTPSSAGHRSSTTVISSTVPGTNPARSRRAEGIGSRRRRLQQNGSEARSSSPNPQQPGVELHPTCRGRRTPRSFPQEFVRRGASYRSSPSGRNSSLTFSGSTSGAAPASQVGIFALCSG